MNWKLFFGEVRYNDLKEYCQNKHMTVSAAIRMAVDILIGKE